MSNKSSETINPSFILNVLGVKDNKDTRMVLVAAFKFIVHMKPGDVLVVENTRLHKVSSDMLLIKSDVDKSDLLDTMEEKKIINLTA